MPFAPRGHPRKHPDDDIIAYLLEDDFKSHKKKKKAKDYKKKVITIQKSHKDDQYVDIGDFESPNRGNPGGPQGQSPTDNPSNDHEGSSYRSSSDLRHWLGEDFFYIRK